MSNFGQAKKLKKKENSPSQENLGKSVKNNNQKKRNETKQEQKSQNGNYTQFSSKIFKGSEYMQEFIHEVKSNKYVFKCMKCKDNKGKYGKVLQVNSLKKHVISVDHRNNTPEEERQKYEELRKLLEDDLEPEKPETEGEKFDKDSKDYLNFITFAMSQRLSFCQIEALGKFLQKSYKEKTLRFLSGCTFDQRLLSKIAQDCIKKVFEEEIKEKLSHTPFSLILDNSTFCGASLCALKVKYLEKTWHDGLKMDITAVKNKIIALSDLAESSTGETLKEIVEKRLFINESIKQNFVGFAHDNGSSLIGENNGLKSLFQKDNLIFFDLQDPCHGLNLVLKHSLEILPAEIMQFVHGISAHFTSPQRKALLRIIQEENGDKILFPKKLATTRWLSLGDCLARIIEIWGSLIRYYDVLVSQIKPSKKSRKKNKGEGECSLRNNKLKSKDIKGFLNDPVFYLKIMLFSYVVNLLNKYNIKFQNQKASVSEIKKNIDQCYNSYLQLTLKEAMLDLNMSDYLEQDWENNDVQKELFLNSSGFITNLINGINSKFTIIEEQEESQQEGFCTIFFKFIGRVLNLLKEYLPFQNKLVESLDFVDLKDSLTVFKQKLTYFCDYFHLLTEEDKPLLLEELARLKNIKISHYQENSSSLLHMWDKIQTQEKLVLIPKLAYFAEALPTTSAGIEQSFSQIKLFKSDLRNRLSEATLEGLVFIFQEFQENNTVCVSEKLMKSFVETKKGYNKKKVQKGPPQKTKFQETLIEEPKIQAETKTNEYPQEELFTNHNLKQRDSEIEDGEDLLDEKLYPVIKKVKET